MLGLLGLADHPIRTQNRPLEASELLLEGQESRPVVRRQSGGDYIRL